MNSNFSLLSNAQAQLLNEILARRKVGLLNRIRRSSRLSRSDAEEIVATLSEEFTNSLDDDWEPTDYGRDVDSVLARSVQRGSNQTVARMTETNRAKLRASREAFVP